MVKEHKSNESSWYSKVSAEDELQQGDSIDNNDNTPHDTKYGKSWEGEDIEYDDAPLITPKRVFDIEIDIIEVKKAEPLPADCYEEGW